MEIPESGFYFFYPLYLSEKQKISGVSAVFR